MLESPKIDAWRGQNRLPEAPKSSQGRLGGSRSIPKRPKSAQERAKSAPRAAQERARAPQERPRVAQERPKSASRVPRRSPGGLPRRPEQPSGAVLTLLSSKKVFSKSDLSHDSLEKRIRKDFRSIFASCAQERTCVRTRKTQCFCRFFVSRLFFASCSSELARSSESASKTRLNRRPRDPKSTHERPKSLFGPLFEPLRSTKSVEDACSSDLGSTWSVERACRSDCRGDLGRSWLARGACRGVWSARPPRAVYG